MASLESRFAETYLDHCVRDIADRVDSIEVAAFQFNVAVSVDEYARGAIDESQVVDSKLANLLMCCASDGRCNLEKVALSSLNYGYW
jgi:hypothetical protein